MCGGELAQFFLTGLWVSWAQVANSVHAPMPGFRLMFQSEWLMNVSENKNGWVTQTGHYFLFIHGFNKHSISPWQAPCSDHQLSTSEHREGCISSLPGNGLVEAVMWERKLTQPVWWLHSPLSSLHQTAFPREFRGPVALATKTNKSCGSLAWLQKNSFLL